MGLTASQQDQDTLNWLVELVGEPMVAVRSNHRGDVTADIRWPGGLQLNSVPCEEQRPAFTRGAQWDALIKQRVSAKKYAPPPKAKKHQGKHTPWYSGSYGYLHGFGYDDWPATGRADRDEIAALAEELAILDEEEEEAGGESAFEFTEWLDHIGFDMDTTDPQSDAAFRELIDVFELHQPQLAKVEEGELLAVAAVVELYPHLFSAEMRKLYLEGDLLAKEEAKA